MSLTKRVLEHQRRIKGNPVSVLVSDRPAPKAHAKRTELEDPTRPHELDPQHVRDALEDDHVAREEGFTQPEPEKLKDPLPAGDQRPRLTQYTANIVRLRALKVRIDNAKATANAAGASDDQVRARWGVAHIWFPEPYADHYELRDGNPPADSQRPKHMRGLKLHLDIWDPWELVSFANSLASISGWGGAIDPRVKREFVGPGELIRG